MAAIRALWLCRIKSKERAQLGHAKSDMLVYCHEALHLKEKAQHAGYKALVEKWDTDSDSSDGSNDELDLAVYTLNISKLSHITHTRPPLSLAHISYSLSYLLSLI